MKKFLVIGILALVVFGCVLAAGCTSQVNTDPDQVNPASGAFMYSPSESHLIVNIDGNGADSYGEMEFDMDGILIRSKFPSNLGKKCLGYFTKAVEGEMVLDGSGNLVIPWNDLLNMAETWYPAGKYTSNSKTINLYAHWE